MLEESIDNVRSFLLTHEGENKFVVDCLKMLDDPNILVKSNGGAPIGTVRAGCKVREQINKERGSPIKGFGELINSLVDSDTEIVLIISIENGIKEYEVFTTPDMDRIIGILSFPDRNKPE